MKKMSMKMALKVDGPVKLNVRFVNLRFNLFISLLIGRNFIKPKKRIKISILILFSFQRNLNEDKRSRYAIFTFFNSEDLFCYVLSLKWSHKC